MRALVTGAGGFIGTNLVPKLLAAGLSVRTFNRSEHCPSLAGLSLEHIQGDITDVDAVGRAVQGCEVVVHLAGLVSYRRCDEQRQWRINVLGTRNVMQAALKAGAGRVIHTSSIAGMGIPEPGTIGNEDTAYNLTGLGLSYCDSKHQAEIEVLACVSKGLPALILSPGIIFGQGDTHPHHRAIFLAMSRGWLIGWPAGGVTFCDIGDVVAGHINALKFGRTGERYVLGSANLTYRQAALVLSEAIGSKPPRFEIPGPLVDLAGKACEAFFPLLGLSPVLTRQVAWLSQRCIFFSNEKAVRELQMPVTPFEETVRRTAAYYLGLREPAAGLAPGKPEMGGRDCG